MTGEHTAFGNDAKEKHVPRAKVLPHGPVEHAHGIVLGEHVLRVGIRLGQDDEPPQDKGDQQRIMTPTDALKAGSDYLVIGRPITKSADPLAALEAIHAEVVAI